MVSAGLKEKLGPVLFQLHPGFHYSHFNLELILKYLYNSFINGIEFRHASWWNPEVFEELQKAGAIFCSISYPSLPDEVIATSRVIYYRFHGVPALYQSLYNQQMMTAVFDNITRHTSSTERYVFFNNTMMGNAVKYAVKFKELSGDGRREEN